MARTFIAPSLVRQRIGSMANSSQIEAALFQGLANGVIYSQADLTIETNRQVEPPKENRPRNKKIDRAHWTRIVSDEVATEGVWSAGSATLEDPALRIELYDIAFDEAHVTALIEKWGVAATKLSVTRTGRPTKDWWSSLAVEMVDLFHREGVPAGEAHEGAETVIRKLQDRLSAAGHDAPSARSIRDTVHNALVRVRGN